MQHEAAGFRPGHVEQVAHQLVEPGEILVHEVADPQPLLFREGAGEEGLGPDPQGSDGRLQLMRDGRGEVALPELEIQFLRQLPVEESTDPSESARDCPGDDLRR